MTYEAIQALLSYCVGSQLTLRAVSRDLSDDR